LIESTKPVKQASDLVRDLAEGWGELCKVSVNLSLPAESDLNDSESLRAAFNEIAKELVANAYRHGKARTVTIAVEIGPEKTLEMTSANDGHPIPKDADFGLGLSMFSELSVSWEILDHANPKFRFLLPVSPHG
jgi:signal transduction histidine kinase